jgi:hypothetical protein
MTLTFAAQHLSYFMAIYLFAYSYVLGLKISDSTKPVRGFTFILSVVMGFVFSCFTYVFI